MNKDIDKLSDFCKMLNGGPAILFLGQDYLRLDSGKDPFLSEILRKYGKISEGPSSYNQILEGDAQNLIESSLVWMHERCRHLSIPQWLDIVASYDWSTVYCSSIDVIWPNAFRSEWREIHSLFEEKYKPIDPRNRLKLHCTYLFGNVSQIGEAERPPLTKLELLKHRQIAVSLARRLPEIITPFGVLILEGYAGERDWFRPEELLPIIDGLNPGQTHIFSTTEELEQDQYIAELVKSRKIILHKESLAIYLLRGEETGLLQLGRRPEQEKYGRRIQLGEMFLHVPTDVWNQVSMSATILDDTITVAQQPLSENKRYVEFRNFLLDSGSKPLWSGYERGFAFTREFEKKLNSKVDGRLKINTLQDEPIILHGQTGTGKSVALGGLAYRIRKERKNPVLFIERKPQKPNFFNIDLFCKWAEDNNAPTTLIVWDGMQELEQYYTLLRYLISRGRKVLMVGSCYRLDKFKDKRDLFIEAPAKLNTSEKSDFVNFINSLHPDLSKLLEESIRQKDETFLVTLYRLLPESRSKIRLGVHHEVGVTENEITRRVQKKKLPYLANTLGHTFLKAGLITKNTFSDELLTMEIKEIGGEKMNEIYELIGLIMVPGRFGLKVPLELLLRAWGKKSFLTYYDLLQGIDFFRLSEDALGNIEVGPRQPLEAKLVTQMQLGGAKAEVSFIKQIILEVKEGYESLNPEIYFAVELIRSIGPKGKDTSHFIAYYRDLSDTLRKLREERGVKNSRLMLQEAQLIREFVVSQSRLGKAPVDTIKILTEAEQILRAALNLIKNNPRANNVMSFIMVELASTLGTKANHIFNYSDNPQDSIPIFQELRKYLFKARDLDPSNYYPIDVFAWMIKDILKADVLDSQARAEAEADILHAFDMVDSDDFGFVQHEMYQKRRMEIANLLGKQKMSDEAFNSLVSKGSCAGYYIRANEKVRSLPINAELTPQERQNCQSAVDYLEKNRKSIVGDIRCLYLLLHTWWKLKTGKPIFYGERQTIPFNDEDARYCLKVLTDLMNIDELSQNPSLLYLLGIVTFQLGGYGDALRIFRSIERASTYVTGRRRIIRSYLASTSNGLPTKYNGTVDWVSDSGAKGEIYVEEFRHNISFIPRDFNRLDIQKYETLNGFHLAFNFIGPIADPIGYLKTR
jgi:hypothetical protein